MLTARAQPRHKFPLYFMSQSLCERSPHPILSWGCGYSFGVTNYLALESCTKASANDRTRHEPLVHDTFSIFGEIQAHKVCRTRKGEYSQSILSPSRFREQQADSRFARRATKKSIRIEPWSAQGRKKRSEGWSWVVLGGSAKAAPKYRRKDGSRNVEADLTRHGPLAWRIYSRLRALRLATLFRKLCMALRGSQYLARCLQMFLGICICFFILVAWGLECRSPRPVDATVGQLTNQSNCLRFAIPPTQIWTLGPCFFFKKYPLHARRKLHGRVAPCGNDSWK